MCKDLYTHKNSPFFHEVRAIQCALIRFKGVANLLIITIIMEGTVRKKIALKLKEPPSVVNTPSTMVIPPSTCEFQIINPTPLLNLII